MTRDDPHLTGTPEWYGDEGAAPQPENPLAKGIREIRAAIRGDLDPVREYWRTHPDPSVERWGEGAAPRAKGPEPCVGCGHSHVPGIHFKDDSEGLCSHCSWLPEDHLCATEVAPRAEWLDVERLAIELAWASEETRQRLLVHAEWRDHTAEEAWARLTDFQREQWIGRAARLSRPSDERVPESEER